MKESDGKELVERLWAALNFMAEKRMGEYPEVLRLNHDKYVAIVRRLRTYRPVDFLAESGKCFKFVDTLIYDRLTGGRESDLLYHHRFLNQIKFADILRRFVELPWWAVVRRHRAMKKVDEFAAEHNECCNLKWEGWK